MGFAGSRRRKRAVRGHVRDLRESQHACVTLAAPCRARGVRLTVFMTRVYDHHQPLFWLAHTNAVERRSVGSLGSLGTASACLRYTRRAIWSTCVDCDFMTCTQPLFGLCLDTRSEARSAGSLGRLRRVPTCLRYARRAMPSSQNAPGHVYDGPGFVTYGLCIICKPPWRERRR